MHPSLSERRSGAICYVKPIRATKEGRRISHALHFSGDSEHGRKESTRGPRQREGCWRNSRPYSAFSLLQGSDEAISPWRRRPQPHGAGVAVRIAQILGGNGSANEGLRISDALREALAIISRVDACACAINERMPHPGDLNDSYLIRTIRALGSGIGDVAKLLVLVSHQLTLHRRDTALWRPGRAACWPRTSWLFVMPHRWGRTLSSILNC